MAPPLGTSLNRRVAKSYGVQMKKHFAKLISTVWLQMINVNGEAKREKERRGRGYENESTQNIYIYQG